MLGDGADAAETARVLVGDERIGPCRARSEDACQILEPAGDEVVHDADADARAHRFELGHRVGAFEALGAPPKSSRT